MNLLCLQHVFKEKQYPVLLEFLILSHLGFVYAEKTYNHTQPNLETSKKHSKSFERRIFRFSIAFIKSFMYFDDLFNVWQFWWDVFGYYGNTHTYKFYSKIAFYFVQMERSARWSPIFFPWNILLAPI